MRGKPLAIVWCADCTAERRSGYRLGMVDRVEGLLLWLPTDPRDQRAKRKAVGRQYAQGDSDPLRGAAVRAFCELTPSTESLPAWCKYHGAGSVAAADVRDHRGSIVAKLVKATA